jgi:putative peptidoglycan lipid II flippase
LLNLTMIAAAVWLAPQMERPVVGLAWGVFIAGIIQLSFQIPFLRRSICCRARAGVGPPRVFSKS